MAILLYGSRWAFPMAPNTHGLELPIDPTQDKFYRIQMEAQAKLHDLVTFEVSRDGQHWTPIARVESNISVADIEVGIARNELPPTFVQARLRSIRCTALQPIGPLPADRDLARVEGSRSRRR